MLGTAGPGAAARGEVGRPLRAQPHRALTTGKPWRALVLAGLTLLGLLAVWGLRWAGPAEVAVPLAADAEAAPAVDAPAVDRATAGGSAAGQGSPDWWAVLAELDERRTDALTSGDASAITAYAVAGSPAAAEDRRLLADLAQRGLRPRGLSSQVLAIESERDVSDGVRLQVVDRRSGYELVAAATGSTVHRVAAAPDTRWAITLARSIDAGPQDPRWRVASVERVATGGAGR